MTHIYNKFLLPCAILIFSRGNICSRGNSVKAFSKVANGKIAITLTELLLIKEWRDNRYNYNFIGGKRDMCEERPLQCAKREFYKEIIEARGTLNIGYKLKNDYIKILLHAPDIESLYLFNTGQIIYGNCILIYVSKEI